MHRFFVEPSNINGSYIKITGSDTNHIRNVLRMKNGEQISICDGNGTDYICVLAEIEKDYVSCEIISKEKSQAELASEIYLFQGLPKGDKMELIIQKAVELGVHQIIPVKTDRTIVKLDRKKEAAKLKRWNMIAQSAAKQSGRGRIPIVKEPVTFQEAIQCAAENDVNLIPYELERGMEATRQRIESLKSGQSIGVFIGPEGGFTEAEIEKASHSQVYSVTLGKRILRTETAGFTMLSILMYHLES